MISPEAVSEALSAISDTSDPSAWNQVLVTWVQAELNAGGRDPFRMPDVIAEVAFQTGDSVARVWAAVLGDPGVTAVGPAQQRVEVATLLDTAAVRTAAMWTPSPREMPTAVARYRLPDGSALLWREGADGTPRWAAGCHEDRRWLARRALDGAAETRWPAADYAQWRDMVRSVGGAFWEEGDPLPDGQQVTFDPAYSNQYGFGTDNHVLYPLHGDRPTYAGDPPPLGWSEPYREAYAEATGREASPPVAVETSGEVGAAPVETEQPEYQTAGSW